MYFIDTETIRNAYKQLTSVDVDNASILHIFLILKACGYNRISYEPTNKISELGYEKAERISILFSPGETKPEKYDFINPFDMQSWHSQSPSEPLSKWVGGRIKNNVLGGATTWRNIIQDDPQQGQFKFTYNYIDEIKKLTLKEQRVSLVALSIWANRFTAFENKVTLKDLVTEFVQAYNLDEEEIGQLTHTKTDSLSIQFSDKIHKAEEIRKLIGNPQSMPEWVEAGKKEGLLMDVAEVKIFNMEDLKQEQVTKELILEGLKDYHQVILSGPPGTSKSYLADTLGKEFDVIKKIQFHPQYSYQDFVGGYVVNKTEVNYKKGVLLDILDYLEKNPQATYLLVIDEINRANVSQVFGETIQCLDRDFATEIQEDGKTRNIRLPENLYILGTMNSSDRTLGAIDHAVRRRFLNIYCPAEPKLLLNLTSADENISLYDFLKKVNGNLYSVLKNRELVLGHSIFLNNSVKKDDKYHWSMPKLEMLFNFKILPTVEEYCYGDESKVRDVLGEQLPQRLHGEDFKKAFVEYCSI